MDVIRLGVCENVEGATNTPEIKAVEEACARILGL